MRFCMDAHWFRIIYIYTVYLCISSEWPEQQNTQREHQSQEDPCWWDVGITTENWSELQGWKHFNCKNWHANWRVPCQCGCSENFLTSTSNQLAWDGVWLRKVPSEGQVHSSQTDSGEVAIVAYLYLSSLRWSTTIISCVFFRLTSTRPLTGLSVKAAVPAFARRDPPSRCANSDGGLLARRFSGVSAWRAILPYTQRMLSLASKPGCWV